MYQYPDYLIHYGVPGMKWGVRRKQASSGSKKSRRQKRRATYSKDYLESESLRKKNYKQLSNAELNKLNKRMNLEQNYKRLNPKGIDKGIAVSKKIIAVGATAAGIYALSKNPWVGVGKNILTTANAARVAKTAAKVGYYVVR